MKNKDSKKNYPVIQVPSTGKPNWGGGARTMCFVYSKHHGNFILEGYLEEVYEYLKTNYTKYFCYFSMWCRGQSRGYWRFWKERDVSIYEPSTSRLFNHKRRYRIVSYKPRYSYKQDVKINKTISLKRMPKKWISEFDKL